MFQFSKIPRTNLRHEFDVDVAIVVVVIVKEESISMLAYTLFHLLVVVHTL
jgi:hypothetical protein